MATPSEEVASSSLLSQQIKRLYDTGRLLGLDDETIEALATPERVLEVKMTVRLKDGRVRTFVGWRSQHNSALGPYKGGVRYHPSTTRDEVVALSIMMTWKNSLLLLPFGGGKGGIRVDPKTLDKEDLEKLSRKYIQQIYMYIGSDKDIPAPDVNTDSQVMAWFLDEYVKVTGRQDFGAFTGKPVEIGGIAVREYSTGLGVATITKMAAEKFLNGIEGKTVIVQGFGNVGTYTVKFLTEMGAKVIGVSDSKGGVIDPEGLDYNELLNVKKATGSVMNYPKGKRVTNEELLTSECDILIPAALENVIHRGNAEKVRAKVIVEAANGPLTADADLTLKRRGIPVVPDILANAGGVVGSYVEWANNKMGGVLEEEEQKRLVISRMEKAFNAVYTEYQKLGDVDLRTAAMALAVERVYRAMKATGRL